MPAFQLLRVLFVLLALLLYVVDSVPAAPVPTLNFHGTFSFFPGATQEATFCDGISCDAQLFATDGSHFVPQFGLAGRTLLAAEVFYDVEAASKQVAHNNLGVPVISEATFFGDLFATFAISRFPLLLYSAGSAQIVGFGSARVLPGESTTILTGLARVSDTLVLSPGDALFSALLGFDQLELLARTNTGQRAHSDIEGCVPSAASNCRDQQHAPISLTITSSGSFDLTNRYCTPGVDLGCPDAIPGLNSPVPEPATLFLFAAGFAVVMAGASRPRES
jgi:hypothetical protein